MKPQDESKLGCRLKPMSGSEDPDSSVSEWEHRGGLTAQLFLPHECTLSLEEGETSKEKSEDVGLVESRI